MRMQSLPQNFLAALGSDRGPHRRGQALMALQGGGVIRGMQDRVGLANVMKELPGPFPRSSIPNDQEIDDWLDHMAVEWGDYALRPVGVGVDRIPDIGGGDDDNHDFFGLIEETVTASATDSSDTSTISLTYALKDAVLWLDSANGRVRKITSLKVDGITYHLGPGGFLPATVCDLTLEPHPLRGGIYVPYAKEQLEIISTVSAGGTDAIYSWSAYAEIDRPKSAANLNMLKVARPFSRELKRSDLSRVGFRPSRG